MPRLTITSTLDPHELVQALAATATEWDVADDLRERLDPTERPLRRSRADAPIDPFDWAGLLARMSREAQMPFADATLAAAEDTVVRQTQSRVRTWAMALMPWIAWSLGRRWDADRLAAWERKTTLPPQLTAPWEAAWQSAWTAGETAALHPVLAPIPLRPRQTHAEAPQQAPKANPGVPSSGLPKPPSRGRGKPPIPLLPAQQRKEAAWIAQQTAALQMREWAAGMQADVRLQVVRAVQERLTAAELERRLADRWRVHGVNFRQIAVTELNAAYNAGMLLALPEHATVYIAPIGDDRVCRECKRLLEGNYFTVLHQPPLHPTKYERETCVWPAKTNRGKDRKDWDPCAPLHVLCRHQFVPLSQSPLGKE